MKIIDIFKKTWFQHISFILIIITISSFFRFFILTTAPKGLNWDEVSYAYNGYSLMKTGADEWGIKNPIYLKAFGDYKPALLSYLYIPFFTLFGATDFIVRFIPATLGVLSICFIYTFLYNISKDKRLSFLVALLASVMPWHIHFSKVALDPIISFFFLIFGLYGFSSKSNISKIIGSLSLFFSIYTYNSARVFTPLIIICYLLIFQKDNIIKKFKYPLIIIFAGTLLIFFNMIFGNSGSRAKDSTVFFDNTTFDSTNEEIYRSTVEGIPLKRLFNNKLITLTYTLTRNYFIHFQPDFLFFDNNISPTHAFSKHPNLLLVTLPFIIIGLISIIRKTSKIDKFFLLWLIISPLSAAVTKSNDLPHPGRVLVMIIPLLYFTVIGINNFISYFKKGLLRKITSSLVAIIFIGNIFLYLKDYYLFYPEESEYYWQGYFQEIIPEVYEIKNAYDKIYFTPEYANPYIFFAWYNKIDPSIIQNRKNDIELENFVFKSVDSQTLNCLMQDIKPNLVIANANKITITPTKQYYSYNRFHENNLRFNLYDSQLINPIELNINYDCDSILAKLINK